MLDVGRRSSLGIGSIGVGVCMPKKISGEISLGTLDVEFTILSALRGYFLTSRLGYLGTFLRVCLSFFLIRAKKRPL